MKARVSGMKRIGVALALCASPSVALAQAQTYFTGQVVVAGFNFCPVGWLPMNGQTLAISDYPALFAVLGTTYGGDGDLTFKLPMAKPIFTANGAPFITCIAQQGVAPSPN
jgi:microcystin-dependent protein